MLDAALLSVFFAALQLDLPVHLGSLTVYHTEIAVALLASWAGWRLLGSWTIMFTPLGLWLLLHTLGPGNPGEGLKGFLRAAEFAVAMALPFKLLRKRGAYDFTLRSVLFTGALAAMWALLQSLSGPGSAINAGRESELIWGFQSAAAGMGQHNQLGAYLTAWLCLALTAFMAGTQRAWALAALALGGLALVASDSRGAWLALVLALLVFSWRLSARVKLWGLATLMLLLVAGLYSPWEGMSHRVATLTGDSDRMIHLRAVWPLWQGHTLWGWGTSGLHARAAEIVSGLPFGESGKLSFSSHMHNFYLQEGLEWGAPVLFLWAFYLLWPLWKAFRAPLPWALGLLGAILAFLAQSATDLLTLHARGMAIAFCWGMLMAGARLAREEKTADEA